MRHVMALLPSISLLFLAFLCFHRISSSRLVEPIIKEAKEPVLQSGHLTPSNRFDPSRVIHLSWHPRAFLYEAFLSDEECDHLISLAHGKLKKSIVIHEVTGKSTLSGIHKSSGMFLARGQDETITRIEERIATWTFLPKENGENMQILNYGPEESYEPYFDYYHDKTILAFDGHRIATVLMYLSNVSKGGETILPMSEMKDAQAKDATWSDCAANGFAVKPIKGNALLFFNLHPDARLDESSLHGGCMVLEGEKWSATKWIHVRAFDTRKPLSTSDVSGCTDEDDSCPQWASSGECQRNPVYMMGTPDYYGSCRKSCGVC